MHDSSCHSQNKQQLHRCAHQSNVTNRLEFLQRKFNTQGEKQQGYAHLGKKFDVMGIGNEHPTGDRTKHNSGQDIPQDQRLTQALGQQPTPQSGNDDDSDIGGDAQWMASLI